MNNSHDAHVHDLHKLTHFGHQLHKQRHCSLPVAPHPVPPRLSTRLRRPVRPRALPEPAACESPKSHTIRPLQVARATRTRAFDSPPPAHSETLAQGVSLGLLEKPAASHTPPPLVACRTRIYARVFASYRPRAARSGALRSTPPRVGAGRRRRRTHPAPCHHRTDCALSTNRRRRRRAPFRGRLPEHALSGHPDSQV